MKLQNDQYLKIASDKEKRINELNAILDKQSKALKLTKVFKSAARQIKYKFEASQAELSKVISEKDKMNIEKDEIVRKNQSLKAKHKKMLDAIRVARDCLVKTECLSNSYLTRIKSLEHVRDSLGQENEALKSDKDSLEIKYAIQTENLTKERDRLTVERDSFSREMLNHLETVENKLTETETKLSESNERHSFDLKLQAQAKNDLDEKESRLKSAEELLNKAKADTTKTCTELAKVKEDLRHAQKNKIKAFDKIYSLSKQLSERGDKVRLLEEKYQRAISYMKNAKGKIEESDVKCKAFDRKCEELRVQNKELEEKVQFQLPELTKLRADMATFNVDQK